MSAIVPKRTLPSALHMSARVRCTCLLLRAKRTSRLHCKMSVSAGWHTHCKRPDKCAQFLTRRSVATCYILASRKMGDIMHRRQFLHLTSSAAIVGVVTQFPPAVAQLAKQIRIVVPFPAGGPTDIVPRPLAHMLGEATKSVVVVDNRGGAGGTIGADAVAKSAPDGQTLLMATVGTHAINPTLYKKLPYDAVKDFTPIGLIAVAPVVVIVNPSLSGRNLAELVALAKQKPGKLNYGSAGVGTPGHLTGEMFKTAAGINIQHVPYKGSAPGVTDLIARQTDIMFDP